MATKPSTTFTHATDANFASGPAIGLPTKVIPPTPNQGLVPGTGGAAEFMNWLFNVLGQWTGWLGSGSSSAGEDAHIVETDSAGHTGLLGLRGPAARYTHAATGGWQDKFRPSLRTFTASGEVPLGAPAINLANFTSSVAGDDLTLFSASLPNSGVVTFEITLTVVTGNAPDDDPQAEDIDQYRTARWQAIALREDGDFTAVSNGTVDYATGGLVAEPPTFAVALNGSQLRIVATFGATYEEHPFRLGYSIRASGVEILDPA